ncbi:MAG TPA: TetR/AcrR family transcriptional regulator [Kofleriaceae bacterium]|nr:TetR/AcrR family transcriptional regulator [Kofleriaceae bacterium]
MKKGDATRARMLQATAELLQKQGYHGTGLAQILEASGAPRGSLYFHFPGGKEELACAALDASGAAWRALLQEAIERAPDPRGAILAVCRALGDELERSGFENGCPIATVALEAAGSSDAVRASCAEQYRMWQHLIEQRLAALGIPERAAVDLATLMLSAIEGAMLLARVQRSREPLERVGRVLSAQLKTVH